MAAEPFYWATQDAWYLWTRTPTGKRKRVFLAKTKKEAIRKWRDGASSTNTNDPPFALVARDWLERQLQRFDRGEVSSSWIARVSWTVNAFDKANPNIRCSRITPEVATAWLDKPSVAYERTEMTTLKQILKWAVTQQLIASSPLAGVRMSKGARREIIIDLAGHRRLVAATSTPEIRAILWFAWWTGSRPSELRLLQWGQINEDCSRATLTKHKTARQVGRPRVIYFNANAQAMLLRHRQQSGFVFRNSLGNPWTKDAMVQAMRRLKNKTGVDCTAYAYRHSYATRALEQGVAIADLAELLGTSIEVISRNYAHLDAAKQRLSEIAKSVN